MQSFKTILHVLFVLVFWHVLAALLGIESWRVHAVAAEHNVVQQDDRTPRTPLSCAPASAAAARCAFFVTFRVLDAPDDGGNHSRPSAWAAVNEVRTALGFGGLVTL